MMQSKAVAKVIHELLTDHGVRRATYYWAENYTVKATRRHRRPWRDFPHGEFSVTMGAPNYEEAKFIQKCIDAGEPFPVKKVQLKRWPEPRKAKKKK